MAAVAFSAPLQPVAITEAACIDDQVLRTFALWAGKYGNARFLAALGAEIGGHRMGLSAEITSFISACCRTLNTRLKPISDLAYVHRRHSVPKSERLPMIRVPFESIA
jgi:hypothetical protein